MTQCGVKKLEDIKKCRRGTGFTAVNLLGLKGSTRVQSPEQPLNLLSTTRSDSGAQNQE